MELLIAAVFCEVLTISPPQNLLHFAGDRGELGFDGRIRKLVEHMLSDLDAITSPDAMASATGLSRAQFCHDRLDLCLIHRPPPARLLR